MASWRGRLLPMAPPSQRPAATMRLPMSTITTTVTATTIADGAPRPSSHQAKSPARRRRCGSGRSTTRLSLRWTSSGGWSTRGPTIGTHLSSRCAARPQRPQTTAAGAKETPPPSSDSSAAADMKTRRNTTPPAAALEAEGSGGAAGAILTRLGRTMAIGMGRKKRKATRTKCRRFLLPSAAGPAAPQPTSQPPPSATERAEALSAATVVVGRRT